MFNLNDPEVRSALIEISQEIGENLLIIPLPVQNGERVDGDYIFSEDDIIGEINASITDTTVNERIASHRWKGIRSTRDQKLKETDVWAMPDRTMTQEQIDYRQALRDITTQSDPTNITWPEKPE